MIKLILSLSMIFVISILPLNAKAGHFEDLSKELKKKWVASLQLMTEQLTTNMMHQAKIVGTFFDAKHQLETQRLLQEKHAQAHKDYHPSQQMCVIGTAVRDLANTQQRARVTKTSLTNIMLDRALATGASKTSTIGSDQKTRRKAYKEKFCNKNDNTQDNEDFCNGSSSADQMNADINFTQSIDAPLTLEIDLLDNDKIASSQEENVFSFLDYIFMDTNFPWVSKEKTLSSNFSKPYQDLRSVAAMRSVAQNSFSEIIAQKSEGPKEAGKTVAPFLKALMKELGVDPTDKTKTINGQSVITNDIEEEIGKNPSYYAQMEILTKKIYQHP